MGGQKNFLRRKKVKENKNDTISWLQYNNIAGIVASALMLSTTFFALYTKVEVLITRVDNLRAIVEKQNDLVAQFREKQIEIDKRLTLVEAEK